MTDARRRILDGLLALAADRGYDAVSVRTVAAAAGVSPAQVQYYFGTRHQLLLAAYERVHERMLTRLSFVDPTGPVPDLLRRYLLAWLPLGPERRADATVWLALTAAAVTSADLAAAARESDAAVLHGLTELVSRGQAEGGLDPGRDPAGAAALLLAVVDGLTVRALTHPRPEDLVPVLDQAIDGLRPTTDRRAGRPSQR